MTAAADPHAAARSSRLTVAARYAPPAIIAIGALLRVARYLSDRSLWLDEIFLANNLLHRSFAGLLRPLDFRQGAPPVFLLLEKLSITLLGPSELVMRLVPLLAGIAALPLMYAVARRLLGCGPALVAVGILALLEPAVYYSSEVKQYSTDLLTTVGLLYLFVLYRGEPTRRRAVQLCLAGVVAIYFSHPAIFVLGGCTIALLLRRAIPRRDLIAIACAWAVAFLPNYYFFLRPLSHDPGLRHHWADAFMPYSTTAIAWLGNAVLSLFSDYATMWMPFPLIGFVAAMVGLATLYLRSPADALLVLSPLLLALLAAAAHAYPFSGRLLLFLVPVPILGISALFLRGGQVLPTGDSKLRQIIGCAVLAVVLLPLLPRPARNLLRPPGREELKPVLATLSRAMHEGDTLYIYHAADAGYAYYAARYPFPPHSEIRGRNRDEDFTAFDEDLTEILSHQRVWLLFSHVPDGSPVDERLLKILPRGATPLASFEAKGAGAYLYDFSAPPAK